MKEFVEKLIKRFKSEQNCADWIAVSDAINIVNQLAEEYSVTGGWIPCSDRLPEPGKRYLVSVIWKDDLHNYRRPAVYDAVFGSDGLWHSYNYEPVSYEVIAWQPLPDPYIPKE